MMISGVTFIAINVGDVGKIPFSWFEVRYTNILVKIIRIPIKISLKKLSTISTF